MIVFPEACDLASLALSLRSGRFRHEDYLHRLEALFESLEPSIHAFLPEPDRFPRLLQEAAGRAERHPIADARPALFTVPIAVDDCLHVAGFVTRAGSRLDPEFLSGPEASSVSALRRAGALFIGKTTTAEFGYGPAGPACNPQNTEQRLPMASSGAAAAVAAGLAPLAVGAQTLGQANLAAARCGVVGFKPSYRRIAADGLIPLAPSLDQVGWIAGNVAGIETAFGLLTPMTTAESPTGGLNIGLMPPTAQNQVDPEISEQLASVCERLRAAGCAVTDLPLPESARDLQDRVEDLVAYEAARVHAPWYAAQREHYRDEFADLIERGLRTHRDNAEGTSQLRLKLREQLAAAMSLHHIDLCLSPAFASLGTTELRADTTLHVPAAVAGMPALTLPAGFIGKHPAAIQLAGHWYGDEQLLRCAKRIESILEQPIHDATGWF